MTSTKSAGVRISAPALIAMAAAWDERRAGGEGRCPACLELGMRPGRVRVRVNAARGAAYYCRRCGAVVSARAVSALRRIQGQADGPPEAPAPPAVNPPTEPLKGLLSAMAGILGRRPRPKKIVENRT